MFESCLVFYTDTIFPPWFTVIYAFFLNQWISADTLCTQKRDTFFVNSAYWSYRSLPVSLKLSGIHLWIRLNQEGVNTNIQSHWDHILSYTAHSWQFPDSDVWSLTKSINLYLHDFVHCAAATWLAGCLNSQHHC